MNKGQQISPLLAIIIRFKKAKIVTNMSKLRSNKRISQTEKNYKLS